MGRVWEKSEKVSGQVIGKGLVNEKKVFEKVNGKCSGNFSGAFCGKYGGSIWGEIGNGMKKVSLK